VRVGIAEKLAIFIFSDKIGVLLRDVRDAAAELLERRHIVFKRDGRLFDVRRVNMQESGGIVKRGDAEAEHGEWHFDHLSNPCTQSERR